jgi:phosphomannomutase
VRNLDLVFKAYDVRGTVPDQLDADLCREVGAAFAIVSKAAVRDGGAGTIVIAHDMRETGPGLAAALAEGVISQGVDAVQLGLASTDGLYYATGILNLPGAMLTASHNPAEYNGIKLALSGARPVGQETGLADIRHLIETGIPAYDGPAGSVSTRDLLNDYAAYMRDLVDLDGIRPLKVVVDAGNGMGGYTTPAVLGSIESLDIVPLFFELDGSFPNHEANPIDPANLRDLQAAVVAEKADLGIAFDGDADRAFIVDQNGRAVSPSTITALVATGLLKRYPGSTIIHNLITSKAVPEIVRENGGIPVRTRVGHSFIKQTMAETNAVFGGEHSGHFYFRDFWRADSGMLAALYVLAALGHATGGISLSELLKPYERYPSSGEINSVVENPKATIEKIKAAYSGRDVAIDELDGLTVTGDTWWFNVRPSNTEPLLRLNAEADDVPTLNATRDEVLAIIKGAK